jgi:hypothetical protein
MDHSELHALKAELHRMQRRVDELEQQDHGSTVSRRNMLRGIGAAAVGAAAGGLVFTNTASATNGANILIGAANQTSTLPTELVPVAGYSANMLGAFTVSNQDGPIDSNAAASCIAAYADDEVGTGHSIGIFGKAKTNNAGASAIGAMFDAPVPLQLIDTALTGAPSSTGGATGQFKVDGGDLWFCVDQKPVGMSQVSTWRQLTGLGVAGGYHPVTPRRVYDSRKGLGFIKVGQFRDVSIKDAIDTVTGEVSLGDFIPPGATAVMANITVTNTVASGYLVCNPGLNHAITSSILNWSAANQTVANGLTVTLNDNRQLALGVNGGGAKAQVIIDVLGYYL